MAAKKRPLEDPATEPRAKKSKTKTNVAKGELRSEGPPKPATNLIAEEVDFPRGGGTAFTPLEVKAIRAEAVKEADKELFQATREDKQNAKKKRKRSEKAKIATNAVEPRQSGKIRIEHLNYKRIIPGMKILGQIASIHPLAVVVSLPDQLFGHVPITNISNKFTTLLEQNDNASADLSSSEEDGEPTQEHIPDLYDLFHVGQYIRCVVNAVHTHGVVDVSGIGRTRDELLKASRRVELSLKPDQVNFNVQKADLRPGFTLSAAVQSLEDHGYSLDLGVPEVRGFLPFNDAESSSTAKRLSYGAILDVAVGKLSSNGRICHVQLDSVSFTSSSISEVSNASSVLPGALVQCLITSVLPSGLNLQVLGFFDGTVDQLHQDPSVKSYKIGQKVKARILYNYSSDPPRFVLSLAKHILALRIRGKGSQESLDLMQNIYPTGAILESVKVSRVEPERGVFVDFDDGLQGFVHISQVSDDHVASLSVSSGPWKIGTLHRARVIGHFALDGLLQLSLKSSILAEKYFQISDLHVGEIIRPTVKTLTDNALFLSISEGIDGVIWPNHYADIALKHPSKRFKPGSTIKCRILVVDPLKKRVVLTAKRTLIDSTLPVLSRMEDVHVGTVTHAVVFKVSDKRLMVEFYNNLKALVPAKEADDALTANLSEKFPVGKVVKVRIIAADVEQCRIVASIRQAANDEFVMPDVTGVEIGNVVEGTVVEVHQDNVVLTLVPSRVRALISIKNLANSRNTSPDALRAALTPGEQLQDLVVVTRNPEKGFVIVANKPKSRETLSLKGPVSLDSLNIGQIVGGRIIRHSPQGTLIKVASHVGGILGPTDASDDYEAGSPFPAVDSVIKAAIVGIDHSKRQVALSTRPSRIHPDKDAPIVDREVQQLSDLQIGDAVRGFVKSVADQGLFVTIGRNIVARVQIRELFDDYIKDWKNQFTTNQVVKGRILSLDTDQKKVEMTLKKNPPKQTLSELRISDLHINQKVGGVVRRIEGYGLFIGINESSLVGLCHKSQLSDNQDADTTAALSSFRIGDRVKAIILAIEKRKISLSLKPSYFTPEDFDAPDAHDGNTKSDREELSAIEEDDHGFDRDSHLSGGEAVDGGAVDSEDSDGEQSDIPPIAPSNTAVAASTSALKTLGGFQWSQQGEDSAGTDDNVLESDESEVEGQPSRKKHKRKQIEQDLTADLHNKKPESNADFERALLGSPNSSYLWIQYMSFQLQLSEIDKAREIARRGISTINFREEQERFNVWIALLNLENAYGTGESLDSAFKEAARANDSKAIHLRLASILDQSGKSEKAEELYKRTCKKFGQSSKVWASFGEYYLRRSELEEARELIPRSLQSLEKRKHLKTISRFAQLEYKLGEPERGKTLFEGIVDSHPKRWDLWSIYMDMEAGQGNIQSLRNLFDRALTIKMTSHKAKSFFKKWLELEKKLGDEAGIEGVKQKAIEWTQKANAS